MAARSLKCGQCGALLANVKEAQNHNEVTGHTQFEETTEVIKVLKCTSCGKPCRTDAERTLHTRMNPGHSEYVEQTNENAVLNSEQEMKVARAELMEDDELLQAAFGKKKAAGGSSGGAAAAGGEGSTGATAMEVEGASGEGASTSNGGAGGGGNMVSPAVDEALVTELETMGFGRNRAVRAIYHSGGAGVEAAINWIMDHENDADIDTPLLVTQASEDAAAKLTPEERKRKAAELLKAAKEKREREERESAALRERERIRAGKELLAAKKKEEEGALARLVEQRQREKAEEAAARAQIQAKLEEDRRERRRKLGLPEELTEEEKAREAQKAAERAEAEKKKVFGHVKPVSILEKQRTLLVTMKKTHSSEEDKWRTAATTLSKYIGNVVANPAEEKFRSIKTTNAAFQSRVACLTGGVEFLEVSGFQKSADGEVLHLDSANINMDVLQGALGALHDMLNNPFFGAL